MLGAGFSIRRYFDGAQFNAGNDKVNFLQLKGYAIEGVSANTKENSQLAVVNLNGKVGKHVNVGGFYTRVNGEDLKTTATATPANKAYKNIYGFNTDINFDKVWVGGEWLKASNMEKSRMWLQVLGYGAYDQA